MRGSSAGWVVLALVTCVACGGDGPKPDATVPSAQFASVQSAIDALPDGSLIEILPGVVTENLVVHGKSIRLIGGGRTPDDSVVRALDGTMPTVSLGDGATLTLENLRLEGGSAGIAGEFSQIPGTPDASVHTIDVVIVGAGRGIYGKFEGVSVQGGEIRDSLVNGISLFGPKGISIDGARIHGNAGVGVFVDNRGAPVPGAFQLITNATIENNAMGGIDVWGNQVLVGVVRNRILGNGVYGVSFDEAHGSEIVENVIDDTKFDPGRPSYWGHAIRVFSSVDVRVGKNAIDRSEGGAMSGWGCNDVGSTGSSSIHVVSNTITKLAPGDLELMQLALPGCTSGFDPPFVDEGGNTCDGQGCRAQSTTLTPIEAPAHTS